MIYIYIIFIIIIILIIIIIIILPKISPYFYQLLSPWDDSPPLRAGSASFFAAKEAAQSVLQTFPQPVKTSCGVLAGVLCAKAKGENRWWDDG